MLWIVDRKTGIRYADKWEAALELGISHNYVSKLARGQKTSPNYDLAIEDDGRPEEGRTQLRRGRAHIEKSSEHPKLSRTLCTDCANFRCSWVQNLKPVEGWEAVPCPQNDSYAVIKCPEFRENERRKKQLVDGDIVSWVSGGSKKANGEKRKQSGTKIRDAKMRSKTFPGIAKAMAEQWGGDIRKVNEEEE